MANQCLAVSAEAVRPVRTRSGPPRVRAGGVRGARLAVVLGVACLLAAAAADAGRTTVVWISIDGMRHDYLERAPTPTFDHLLREGAHTRQLVPGFPSLTFPMHVTKATGVPPGRHGITSNRFYDARRERTYNFPPWANLVEVETLWSAATRQGVRVAVHDWPLAHAQTGEHASAYFLERFDGSLSDRERLEALLDRWEADLRDVPGGEPLRLLATWIGEPDVVGHRVGPDAPEIGEAIAATDALLAEFLPRAMGLWRQRARAGDGLVLALTTDHGMSAVHTLVHPTLVLGLEGLDEGLILLTSGSIANLHVNEMEDPEQVEALVRHVLQRAAELPFLEAHRRDELPERWGYAHPRRTGDLVLSLSPGHTFSRRPSEGTAPVSEFDGPLGMHGYDPELDPDMHGVAVFWRWPEPWGGVDLGRVELVQLHPTLAALLGIEPAADAQAPPVALPGLAEPAPDASTP